MFVLESFRAKDIVSQSLGRTRLVQSDASWALSATWSAFASTPHARAVHKIALRDGYPAAQTYLARIVHEHPAEATPSVLGLQALCLLHMGDPEKAAAVLGRARTLGAPNASLCALEAIALVDVQATSAPKKARAQLALALTLANVTQDDLSCAPEFLALATAKVALHTGDYTAARHAIDEAVQQAPRCALTRSIQAEMALVLSGPDTALRLCAEKSGAKTLGALQSPHMQAVRLMAEAQRVGGCPKAAARCQAQLDTLSAQGSYVPYTILAAACVAQATGDAASGLAAWTQAPDRASAAWLPASMQRVGVLVGTDAVRAADVLRGINKGSSKHPLVRRARATLLEAQGQHDLARATWARLAQETVGSVRSDALWAQAGRPEGTQALSTDARKVLERLIAHAPKHPQALYQLANDALVRGACDEAQSFATRLLDAGDETGRAHFILGMTCADAMAGQHFRRFLEAPKRDAALLDEARLYIAHEAFAQDLWDEAIEQVRAFGAAACGPDVDQTLSYLAARCEEGRVLRQAEQTLRDNRTLLAAQDVDSGALETALESVKAGLDDVASLRGGAQLPLRLFLLSQKAWLQYRLGHSAKAAQSLAAAREVFDALGHLAWPVEAEETSRALQAERWAWAGRIVAWVMDLLKTACTALGSRALVAGAAWLEAVLRGLLLHDAQSRDRPLFF